MGEIRKRGQIWWVRYYRDGHRHEESSRSRKKGDAERLLKLREGAVARGIPVTAKMGQLRFEEAAEDMFLDYRVNKKRTLADVECRVRKHLRPMFGGRRMASITTADVQRFVARRQAANASNGEINRELTVLKRMFSLSLQGGKLLIKPHIPLLHENNVRTGFFEQDQFEAVVTHLPDELAMMLRFAYITGWRVRSEIQTLQWRQVDFEAGEVRLDPGTTKNKQGRTFPFTDPLWEVLVHQRTVAEQFQRTTGTICPWVFHRQGRPIKAFVTAWRRACTRAGCPGKIPHDLRRTAVRDLIRAGVSEPIAMAMTGHLTRSVFDRYNIVSSRDLRNAAALLNQARRTQRTYGTATDRDNYRDSPRTKASRADPKVFATRP